MKTQIRLKMLKTLHTIYQMMSFILQRLLVLFVLKEVWYLKQINLSDHRWVNI